MAVGEPSPNEPPDPVDTRRIPGPLIVFDVLADGTVTAKGGGKIGVGRDANEALADLRVKLADIPPRA
jgi:hypothetical protein